MEFGPRALGGRSIIGDPRNQEMQSVMNLKIKYRESFRPFAPSVLEEDVANQFERGNKSPYMLLVSPLKKELCKDMTAEQKKLFGIDKLKSHKFLYGAKPTFAIDERSLIFFLFIQLKKNIFL